jgi:hypothetical protein
MVERKDFNLICNKIKMSWSQEREREKVNSNFRCTRQLHEKQIEEC